MRGYMVNNLINIGDSKTRTYIYSKNYRFIIKLSLHIAPRFSLGAML